MAVMTSVATHVEVRVWARSTTWVANEIARVMLDTVVARGLPLDYMHSNLKALTDGFRTWIAGRWLKGAIVEVYDTASDTMVERFDLDLAYQPTGQGGRERFTTDMDRVKAALAKLPPLRPGCRYHVLADLTDDAPELPGWSDARTRDTGDLQKNNVGKVIDTARIGVDLSLWVKRSTDDASHLQPQE